MTKEGRAFYARLTRLLDEQFRFLGRWPDSLTVPRPQTDEEREALGLWCMKFEKETGSYPPISYSAAEQQSRF